MLIAEVIGTVVATRKHERLVGGKIQVVRPLALGGGEVDAPFVALDAVGAGVGERVIVVRGTNARRALDDVESPVDAAIIGIVDQIDLEEGL